MNIVLFEIEEDSNTSLKKKAKKWLESGYFFNVLKSVKSFTRPNHKRATESQPQNLGYDVRFNSLYIYVRFRRNKLSM